MYCFIIDPRSRINAAHLQDGVRELLKKACNPQVWSNWHRPKLATCSLHLQILFAPVCERHFPQPLILLLDQIWHELHFDQALSPLLLLRQKVNFLRYGYLRT